MTVNEFVYNGLHQLFTELAVKLADGEDDPDMVAAIPFQTFRAENYMCAAWDGFIAENTDALLTSSPPPPPVPERGG